MISIICFYVSGCFVAGSLLMLAKISKICGLFTKKSDGILLKIDLKENVIKVLKVH